MQRVILALVLTALLATQASAQPRDAVWNERPYDPPVGSKWQMIAESQSEESHNGGPKQVRNAVSRAEFTIEEKLPDGFRMSYVNRDLKVTGSASYLPLLQEALSGIKDVVVRIRTDKSGKPLVVENLADVRRTMQGVVERLAAPYETKNPQTARALRNLMGQLLVVDGEAAARSYAEDMPSLAVGQSTGLKPGEMRRATEELPTAFGSFKSSLVTSVVTFDNASGKARIVRKRETDPAVLRELVSKVIAQLASQVPGGKLPPESAEAAKLFNYSIEEEATIDVEDGIARRVLEVTNSKTSAQGERIEKLDKKTIIVTRL